jgi:predicted amidohydrolase YtcJ
MAKLTRGEFLGEGATLAAAFGGFVVLGQDPHEIDPDRIIDIPVARTAIGGRTVHEG